MEVEEEFRLGVRGKEDLEVEEDEAEKVVIAVEKEVR